MQKPSIGLLSLGCVRNLVDSEIALGALIKQGYIHSAEVSEADIAIVNTCGFTEDAKKESLESIFELCRLKSSGQIKKVVVMGCLSQRYLAEMKADIPEVDLIVGTDSFERIPELLQMKDLPHHQERATPSIKPTFLPNSLMPKKPLTPDHYRYIKISEGCINACSYCAIPSMKGRHRSRPIDDIVTEALQMQADGVKEINLIGQDTAAYGMDFSGKFQLAELLKALDANLKNVWVRLLYAHPAHVTEEQIEVMSSSEVILPYIDVPIEHSHPDMLQRMNRGCTREQQDQSLDRILKKMPDAILRTAVIVGFPGETHEEHADLLNYMRHYRFQRLGAFMYSREENTKSYDMPDQIDPELMKERFDEVMHLQADISEDWNRQRVGSGVDVLVEGIDDDLNQFWGRTAADAPDVDARALFKAGETPIIGEIVSATVIDSDAYDVHVTTV